MYGEENEVSVSKEEMLDTLEHCRLTMTYHEVQALAGKWNKHDEEVVQAIRALIERQPKVSREWFGQMAGFLSGHNFTQEHPEIAAQFLRQVLREAGVEVEE